MKIRILLISILAVVLLIFQLGSNNYIEPNPAVPPGSSTTDEPVLSYRVSPLKPSNATSILLLNARNTIVMDKKRLREKKPYYYELNLQTGKLVALDYLEKTIEENKYCFPRDRYSELLSILEKAQICESPDIEEPNQNVLCKRSYTLPFVMLIFEESTRVLLGEKNSACDFPTILCGDSNTQLINWVQRVLLGIKELDCP